MITASFLCEDDGWLAGFELTGHADYSEAGSDIVCAAVSSAAYLVVNTVTDALHVAPMSLRAEEGDLFFRVRQKDEETCQPIFVGLKLHLQQLEEQYPDHLRVGYIEI